MTSKELMHEAIKGRTQAYVPYSDFPVGAAVMTHDGRVFRGCNIENAAYGPTNCAERTAIFSAIAAGVREFAAIAVVADTDGPCMPCGVCRQVMSEFLADNTPIYLGNIQGELKETTITQLLPGAFTERSLEKRI